MYKMGRRMRIHNVTEFQEEATKPSYWFKSSRDAPQTGFEASEPMAVPHSNSRKYDISSSISVGASSIDGIEQMYDWATWRMYDRITSARQQASLARVLAGEADQTPARVFSRVDVNINKPQDQATTTPLAFQTIPSKSRTTINHRHARYTYEDTFAPSLVSDTTYEEDFVEESYHEGEVFTLDI